MSLIKSKILFILQLPPPVHGASMMNKYILESDSISKAYSTYYLPLQFASDLEDIGKLSFKKILKMFSFAFNLIKTLASFKPNLIYFTIAPFGGAFYRDAFFVLLIRMFNKKIVFHLHGKGIKDQIKSPLKRKIYKYTFKKSSVITLSKMLDYDIKEIHNGPIYHLANGIEINNIKGKLTESNENIKILYLSNLVKTKGVLDFVEAISLISDLDVDYEVSIVGKPVDVSIKELESLIIKKNLSSKVSVQGPKYGNEKWDALLSSDIFVFPTYFKNECFPLVLLEAMQSRNAIISTNNGAIEEIIKNCGEIVPQNSPKDLAAAIKSLLLDKQRVELLKEKSKEEFDAKYTLETFESNFIKVINSVLIEKG